VQLKAIDIMAFMAHKTKDSDRFKAIIDLLAHPTPEEGLQTAPARQRVGSEIGLKRNESLVSTSPNWVLTPLSKIEMSSLNRMF